MSSSQTSGNPAPLGLLGFGMTTILLNIHNSGIYPLTTMILAMGIFIGGLAQVIAGIQEWKMGNTFGASAFSMYGFFWLSFVALNLIPAGKIAPAASLDMGFYLLIWGIFTFVMFFGTIRISRAHQIIFMSLAILFFLLAIGDWTGSSAVKTFAGIEGIFCGGSAFYTAAALILNEVHERTVLPIGIVKR